MDGKFIIDLDELNPFLEPKHAEIEKLVRPIQTVRSTKEFIKE
ncbi:hypothetical protein [Neobacillus sp. PS3-40]|nr:hypothetical protein [Neobacillus sp. PS3-40]WML46542.1 hypothetical protein RCG20_13270 [Neobacillus sp. PS3-40]